MDYGAVIRPNCTIIIRIVQYHLGIAIFFFPKKIWLELKYNGCYTNIVLWFLTGLYYYTGIAQKY